MKTRRGFDLDGSVSCLQVQWLLASPDGAPTFALRRLTLEPECQTHVQSRPWEHDADAVRCRAVVAIGETEPPLRPDCVVLVLPDEVHCFRSGDQGLQFVCLVPLGEATRGR